MTDLMIETKHGDRAWLVAITHDAAVTVATMAMRAGATRAWVGGRQIGGPIDELLDELLDEFAD